MFFLETTPFLVGESSRGNLLDSCFKDKRIRAISVSTNAVKQGSRDMTPFRIFLGPRKQQQIHEGDTCQESMPAGKQKPRGKAEAARQPSAHKRVHAGLTYFQGYAHAEGGINHSI